MTARKMALGVLALTLAGACSQGADEAPDQTAELAQPIMGGVPAVDARYAAVGALATQFYVDWIPDVPPFYAYDFICSATLVDSQAVVTARHCTETLAQYQQDLGDQPVFLTGDFTWDPEQVIPITGWVAAPPSDRHPGLLLDGGRDVAVAYLAGAPEGIEPARVGHFNQQMVGKQFELAGYGWNDYYLEEWGFDTGEKMVGVGTARALEGQWYSLLFDDDYDAYLDWFMVDADTSNPTEEQAQGWWNAFWLEPGYELLTGGLEGEALSCYGDSGGPLLSIEKDKLTVYGVSFATEPSQANLCDHGSAYLVFNEEMHAFVNRALSSGQPPLR